MPDIEVVAGVIRNIDGQILLAQRPADKHEGGLWEVPVGKPEPGESFHSALVRELFEELGISVAESKSIIRVTHHYHDKNIILNVREVLRYSNRLQSCEGQALVWVEEDQLTRYAMPEADQKAIAAIRQHGIP